MVAQGIAFCIGALCIGALCLAGMRCRRESALPGGRGESTTAMNPGGDSDANLSFRPLVGSPGAEHEMVWYFDYQRASCRVMAGHLAALVDQHPAAVAVRLAPVPMEYLCNPHVLGGVQRPGSCCTVCQPMRVCFSA